MKALATLILTFFLASVPLAQELPEEFPKLPLDPPMSPGLAKVEYQETFYALGEDVFPRMPGCVSEQTMEYITIKMMDNIAQRKPDPDFDAELQSFFLNGVCRMFTPDGAKVNWIADGPFHTSLDLIQKDPSKKYIMGIYHMAVFKSNDDEGYELYYPLFFYYELDAEITPKNA